MAATAQPKCRRRLLCFNFSFFVALNAPTAANGAPPIRHRCCKKLKLRTPDAGAISQRCSAGLPVRLIECHAAPTTWRASQTVNSAAGTFRTINKVADIGMNREGSASSHEQINPASVNCRHKAQLPNFAAGTTTILRQLHAMDHPAGCSRSAAAALAGKHSPAVILAS